VTDPSRIPVLIGAAQLRANRDRTVDGAREPLELLRDAACRAAGDTGLSAARLLAEVDDVSAVCTASWAYDELAVLVAAQFGASPSVCSDAPVGGQWPVRMLDAAAGRIAAGETTLALIVGGEAQASVTALGKAGVDPASRGWRTDPGGPPHFDPEDLGTERMIAAGTVLPARVYAMVESRLQADLGLTPEENHRWSAELYAAFSEVAAQWPAAWSRTPRTADDIATVGPQNRMVYEPYPLSMNAMPHVDQAAAVLLTSLARARELGVAEDRLVYVWGGAGADDSVDLFDRASFGRSTALTRVLDRTLDQAGLVVGDVDLLDVYSCFPVVPKLALLHWNRGAGGLPHDLVPTVTGGHSAFGGPLNSYSLHAVVAMKSRLSADRLRAPDGTATTGLVHANGGYLTYQHAVLLATAAHPDGYVGRGEPEQVRDADAPRAADPRVLLTDGPVELAVETATVQHGRDGAPAQAFVVGRTDAGIRTGAATAPGDASGAAALSLSALPPGATTHVGRRVQLVCGDGQPVLRV
jgi:acetyl-CoA C-acetyltransferase